MNYHASLLVDHHQRIVLVHNIQRNILCHNTGVVLGTIEHQGDDIIGAHLIVCGEELVYTHRRLTGIHLYLPMLV